MNAPKHALRCAALARLVAAALLVALLADWPGVSGARLAAASALQEPARPGRLSILRWTVSRALIRVDQSATIRVTVRNGGEQPLTGVQIEGVADQGLAVLDSKTPPAQDLAAGETLEGEWEVSADRAEQFWFHFSVRDGAGQVERLDIPIAVTRLPAPPPRIEVKGPRVHLTAEKDLVFENKSFTSVLVRNSYGYGPLLFYPNSPRNRPRPPLLAAVVTPLSRVIWREGNGRLKIVDFYPQKARIINGQPKVHLDTTVREGDQTFDFGTDLEMDARPWLNTSSELRAVQGASIVHFSGPIVRVGEGDEGAEIDQAVFPGLEYLGPDDVSSDDNVDDTPNQMRLAPDPYKVTVPAMGIVQNDTFVGLLWNPHQKWDDSRELPAAVFDVPNRSESQDNSRMGIFAPGIPEFCKENETLAHDPYPLGGGKTLTLEAKVAVLPDETRASEAVRLWVRAFGLPGNQDPPRDFATERAVCRRAYTDVLWEEEVPGWHEALPVEEFPARPLVRPILALVLDAALNGGSTGEALFDQAESVVEALEEGDRRDENGEKEILPLDPRLAYRFGGVVRSLREVRAQASDAMAEQTFQGGWLWDPEPDSEHLGRWDAAEVGITCEQALPVLRFALISGDTAAIASGIHSLEYMMRFHIPRGAQNDELPLEAPDLLAAAWASEAYAIGYQITGRTDLLRYARYWADAGLPFIYFWREEHRDAMEYASIPGFGASHFTRSWFGVARQAIGLQYARALRRLDELQPDPLYDRIATGIVSSAERMQFTEGDRAGLYPETWEIYDNEAGAPFLNPELLLVALYANEGYEMELSSQRGRIGGTRLFVTSCDYISNFTTSATRMNIWRHAPGAVDSFTSIVGFAEAPTYVRWNGRNLPQVEKEDEVGWQWLEEMGAVLVRTRHEGSEGYDRLEIKLRQPVRSPRERTLEVPYSTRGGKVP